MKRKIRVTKKLCELFPFNEPCGCPLYEQMNKAGFEVDRIDVYDWTGSDGKKHKFPREFSVKDYAEVLTTGKPFEIVVDDESWAAK